ncbi:hypothetical protein Aperf_G00000025531 [Anoplocephala perfoliata]
MDDDASVLPPNHPLRTYLRNLSLDDIDEIDPYDISMDNIPAKNDEPHILSRSLSSILLIYHRINSFPKRFLLERLIKSGYILSNDRAYLQVYKKELDNSPSHQISYFGILCTAPILLALLLTNSTIANVILVKYVVGQMEELFSTFIRSVKFLRGLAGVEMGFIFTGRVGIGQSQLDRVVLPNFTAKLFDAARSYALNVVSISQGINLIIESSDSLSSRLREIDDPFNNCCNDPTVALNQEQNLRGIKTLLDIIFGLNSEVIRVFGCFFTLHFSESSILDLKMFRLVGLWMLSLWRAKHSLRSVEIMQTNLLKGEISSDELSQKFPESSVSSVGQANVTKMLSALSSLHYNVLAWSLRIHNLREKLIANSTNSSLLDFVVVDIEPMRLLHTNCQLCLDEIDAALRDDEQPSSQTPQFEFSKSVSEEVSDNLIPLDSEQPPVEDECLEAVVGEDDLQSNELDEFYDEFDYSGRPLTKTEMKKRNAERAVLLTELNSVIAHRMLETREREEKALSRARGSVGSSRSQLSQPLPQETATDNIHFEYQDASEQAE